MGSTFNESPRMRVLSRWVLTFSLLLVLSFFTYIYNYLSFERTANSLYIMLGPRITISYNHQPNEQHGEKALPPDNFPLPRPQARILIWSKSLANKGEADNIEERLFPAYGKAKLKCPIRYAFLAGNYEGPVDAVVIDAKQSDHLPRRTRGTPWILYYEEPPVKNRNLDNKTYMSLFNYSIGYRMDSDFPNPRISEPSTSQPLHFHQKYDYAATVFSTCSEVRTKYVQELSKNCRIKAYGDCLRNVEKNNLVRKGEKDYIASKIRLLRMHKFALNLMKFDCEDYVDETLNHSWEAGTLPLFLGTDSLQMLLPKYLRGSYLPISRFKKPLDLADQLDLLVNDKTEYDKFMAWRYQKRDVEKESQLEKIWNPLYSPGCEIALRLKNDRIKGGGSKVLNPIKCIERSLDFWLGEKPDIIKPVND